MLTILLLLLIILIPSFYFYIKSDIDVEKIIPCTVISIVLIIYVFGLLNLLKYGVYIIWVICLLLLVLLIQSFIKRKASIKECIKILLKPSLVFFVFGAVALYFYYKERLLLNWDEFSHWGDVVKMMYYNNIFNTNPASMSAANGYPPVMSIFQYFVENLSVSGYKESYLYIAYHIFVISLIIPFIKDIKWRNVFRIILSLIIIVIVPTLFFAVPYYYYAIIYIDPFLGILFGCLMANIYITKKYEKFDIIHNSLVLFALTLTKDIAPVFSFIALSVVFWKLVIDDKNYNILKKFNKKKLLKFVKKTQPVWIFLLVIIVSYISWKLNILLNVKSNGLTDNRNLKDMILLLLHNGIPYRNIVIENYINSLWTYRFTSFGNIYLINSILVIFSILLYNKEEKANQARSVYTFVAMFIGEAFYLLLTLILYLLMCAECTPFFVERYI